MNRILILLAVALLTACEPSDPTPRPKTLVGAEPTIDPGVTLAPPAKTPQPLAAGALWPQGKRRLADVEVKNPWASFAPGSWAIYALNDGTEERWTLTGKTADSVQLSIDVRKTSTSRWESAALRVRRPLDRWAALQAMGGTVKVEEAKYRRGDPSKPASEHLQVDAQLLSIPSRKLAISAAVPGGVVRASRTAGEGEEGAGGQILERELVAFGVAP